MNIPYVFKKCTKCGKILPATKEYFYKEKRGKYGLTAEFDQTSHNKQSDHGHKRHANAIPVAPCPDEADNRAYERQVERQKECHNGQCKKTDGDGTLQPGRQPREPSPNEQNSQPNRDKPSEERTSHTDQKRLKTTVHLHHL